MKKSSHLETSLFDKNGFGRYFLVVFVLIMVFALLVFRLFHVQIVEGERYYQMADANRHFRQPIPAQRGVFLDRYHRPFVNNIKQYFESEEDLLFPQKKQIDHQSALKLIAENDWSVSFEYRRLYKYPWYLAHVTGYIGPVIPQELIDNKQLKVNDQTGKMGLEKEYDQVLRGRDGYQVYEINTLGEKQQLVSKTDPIAGNDILTSLDPYLSKIAYESLGEMMGAVVVLDADTGQVLVLVNKPSFNPNDFSNSYLDQTLETERKSNLQQYFQDERRVFFNRAISGTYPPGSVFKLVTSVAGLETNAFDENQTVLDEGILKVGDYEYRNWLYTQRGATDGEIALIRAIARSNDIFFYKAAEWTGPTTIANHATVFGFGKKTGIELSSEARGLVPDPTWKEEVMGERWFLGNTYHFGIGQGDMTATPLQIAQFIQAIGNRGELCHPSLIIDDGKNKWSTEKCENLGLQDRSLELTLKGMIAACQPGGTGSRLFSYNQEFPPVDEINDAYELLELGAVGCKTGTSEFGAQDEGGRRKTHGWFVTTTALDIEKIKENLKEKIESDELDGDNQLSILSDEELHQWLEGIEEYGFPKKAVLVALVESDEAVPYKEGSREAAPIVDALLTYLK